MEKTGILYHIRRGVYLFIKRLFDIFCAIFGVLLLIPLIIIIKIAHVIRGDFHSIFYSQKRVGNKGKIFNIYKFRTMVPNAEEELEKLLKKAKYKKQWEANHKLENDPRITKVGRFLRDHSIDEFPQFLNVLFGQMSMIGNRPYLTTEIRDMGKHFDTIISVKPGITGYWQSRGRNDISFEERLKYEVYYAEHRSFIMDMRIFFRTFIVVFKKTGAK